MNIVNTKYSENSTGHYSAGIISGNYVFVSGQLSLDPEENEIPKGGIEVETKMALKNVENVLHAAGVTKDDVVMCRIYIPDVGLWDSVNKVYGEFFGGHKPARIVVPSNKLHSGCLIEIEAVAEIQDITIKM